MSSRSVSVLPAPGYRHRVILIHFGLHCRVQYEGCTNRWTFHPAALKKVCTFQVDDIVTIINDAAKVEKWQKGHGEWVETMRNVITFLFSPLRFHLNCSITAPVYHLLIFFPFFQPNVGTGQSGNSEKGLCRR